VKLEGAGGQKDEMGPSTAAYTASAFSRPNAWRRIFLESRMVPIPMVEARWGCFSPGP